MTILSIQEIDTALVKLLAKEGDCSAFEEFVTSNCACDLDDCLEWLVDGGMHHCRAVLLFRFGQPIEAYGVWKKLAFEEIKDPNFPGIGDCIDRLVKCTERDVFAVVPWIVTLDAETTVEVCAIDFLCDFDCFEIMDNILGHIEVRIHHRRDQNGRSA